MVFHFTTLSLFAILVANCLIPLSWSVWQRRLARGAFPLLGIAASIFVWLAGTGLELAAVNNADKILFAKIQYFGIVTLPVFWLLFALEYEGLKFSLQHIAALCVLPAINLIMVWTNELHKLVWSGFETLGDTMIYQHGIWFWVIVAYNYFLIFYGIWRIVSRMRQHTPQELRLRLIILFGAFIPFIANLLYLTDWNPLGGIDPTPLAFSLTLLLYTWGLFRLDLLELQPVALNAVVESLGDAVLVLNEANQLTFANRLALTLLNIPRVEGQHAEKVFANHTQILQNANHTTQREISINLPINNQIHTFDLRVQGLYASNNRLLGRMVILHDATERRTAEERFRRLLEAAPDAMLVVDEFNMIQTANKRAFNIFGYSREEMIGMDMHRIVSPRSLTYPETARTFNNSLATGEPYEGLRLIAIHKDGHEFPFESSLSPLETPDGRLLIINARDISDRQATEEQLRLQSVALSSAANGILIADRTGRIVWVNPAFTRMTGYELEEAVGRMSNLLRSGEHDQSYYDKLWSTILSGQIWQGEMINRRKDGSTYIEEQTIAPVMDTYGNVTHFVSIKNDISERKQLEQMRDNLLHTLVHDLRNPLNNILSSLNIAMYEATPENNPEAHDSFMSVAQISAQRMESLVSSILDLNKLESGSMPLNCENTNLAQVVESVLMIQATLANTKKIEIINCISPEMTYAWADPVLTSRVLQNLLDNAIKFSPEDSQIEVGAGLDERKQFIIVSVHDHGAGISPELQSRLFQKFASGSRGTGIGLAFCRLAVEAHGGRIWVESPPDEGTTFYFSLPIARTGTLSPERAVFS